LLFNVATTKPDDLDDIAAFLLQDNFSSWSIKSIRAALRQPGYFLRKAGVQHSAVSADHCVGYYFVQQIVDQLTLLYLYVAPENRQQGIGRLLLSDMMQLARQRHCVEILLEVRKSNQPAIALYNALNFKQVGCRRNYYPALPKAQADTEDALLFSLDLQPNDGEDHALC